MTTTSPVVSFAFIACTAGALVGCRDLHLVDPAENASVGGSSDAAPSAGTPSVRTSGSPLLSHTGGKPGFGGAPSARGGALNANGGALNANGGVGFAISLVTNVTGGVPASIILGSGSRMNAGGSAGSGGVPTIIGGSSDHGASTANFGGNVTGGAPSDGGAPVTGGAPSDGGAPVTGGAPSDGGAPVTGGAPSNGGAPATGGASSSVANTGGMPQLSGIGGTPFGAGGTSQLGGAGSSTCNEPGCGAATVIGFGTGGSTSPVSAICPQPLTKPKTLTDFEPKPNDPCARVTTVVAMGPTSSAFGFTNGEIWFCPSEPGSCTRVDTGWMPGNPQAGLPRAIVSALKSIRHNNEGTLSVGYVDALGELTPWHAAMLARGWNETPVSQRGTVMSLFTCPFHGNVPSHLGVVTAPGYVFESLSSPPEYSFENGTTTAEHMGLFDGTDDVTTVDTFSESERWIVFAGSRDGALVKSSWIYQDAVTWNQESHSLNFPVAWTSLRTPELPVAPVVRVAVDPKDSDRILVVFNRRKNANEAETADALWLSEDGGATWINRSKGLPTTTSQRYPSPILGATFHPTLKQVAYVVTPDTSYYSVNSGETWQEW